MSTFMDKLGVIWKGPSWFPGIPRLGLDKYKINVSFIFYTLLRCCDYIIIGITCRYCYY